MEVALAAGKPEQEAEFSCLGPLLMRLGLQSDQWPRQQAALMSIFSSQSPLKSSARTSPAWKAKLKAITLLDGFLVWHPVVKIEIIVDCAFAVTWGHLKPSDDGPAIGFQRATGQSAAAATLP